MARCPEGRTSVRWREFAQPLRGITVRIAFDRRTCQACVSRARCTQARAGPRTLSLLPQAEHAAAQRRRRRREQETAAWRQSYARRAGVEGTLSQGIRAFGLRRCRYIGLAKAHLQHVLTAVAINLVRLDAWLRGEPSAPTRISRFTRLKAALG